MAEWGTSGAGQAFEAVGADGANSTGTLVTAHATINTKGTWVELVAATARDASAILVEAQAVGTFAGLLDIGIGGAGSETTIVENLPVVRRTGGAVAVLFPLPLPAGTRIAARCQATVTVVTLRVKAILIGRGFEAPPALGLVTTYGAATADSGGTTVDPGAVAHTDSAWVELAASASACRWVVFSINEVSALFGISVYQTWLLDLAVGAAASEVEIVSDLLVSANPESDCFFPFPLLLPLHIPAGSRVAVRARCISTDASDRRLDVVLHGIA